MQVFTRFLMLSLLLLFAGGLLAQDEPSKSEDSDKKKGVKSYRDVVTKEAITSEGLFTVHKVDGKYLFELPTVLLDDEILIVSRISGHVKGLNFGGAGMKSRPQQVIRWQRHDDQILLRSVSYNSVADENNPIYRSVRNNNFEPVIMAFKIMAYRDDSSAMVFDATPLFTTDVPMIGALQEDERKEFSIKGLDKSRSLITSARAFPLNVEIRHIMTYNGDKLPDNILTGTLSVEMNQSFILLPAQPMQPRLHDARVGYFSIQQTDYGLDAQRAEKRRYITRWRLEPKDWEAWKRGEVVEVVKPIEYYIDPATPLKWRPYIKQGVNDWQQTFEAIGFKNAIVAKDPPTAEEDPDWSPEDVRYSVIRYITTDIQNAQGPHVHDPRTGEILESDILWYHNVMNLLRNWYLIQTAAVDPNARSVRFKDELMGDLIRFVAAHEVGHTLGLPHNMGSSAAYPVDSLRSPGFVQRMGTAPSIMDYARFNYVAQPEDQNAGLSPRIGMYDYWSIEYGYRPIPDAKSAEAERTTLNEWVRQRAGDARYRYGQQRSNNFDPSSQTEDLGDDAVLASQYGILNLKRIVPNLVEWSSQPALPFDDLEELYSNVVNQLRRYSGHVAANVGGLTEWRRTADEDAVVYTPVPRDKQARAVDFLGREIFATPTWLLDNNILQRIEPDGVLERVRSLQLRTLQTLFNKDRLQRLIETRALHGTKVYGLDDLMNDTRRDIFGELSNGATVDVYRRNLQRGYVEELVKLLNSEDDAIAQSDVRAVSRATLTKLQQELITQGRKASDEMTRIHYRDLSRRIERAFDPE